MSGKLFPKILPRMGQVDASIIPNEECPAEFVQLVEGEWLLVENTKDCDAIQFHKSNMNCIDGPPLTFCVVYCHFILTMCLCGARGWDGQEMILLVKFPR